MDLYGRDRDQWPLFRTKSAEALMQHIGKFVGLVFGQGQPAVLCFYFHPWEFLPMPAEFHFGEGTVIPDSFLIQNCGEYALEQLGVLIGRLKEHSARFTTARALAANLKTCGEVSNR